jgi:hypothetical protein
MASDALSVLLALIGIGIIVVGILILMQHEGDEGERSRIIVREPRSRWFRGYGPYYSHLPRPILY